MAPCCMCSASASLRPASASAPRPRSVVSSRSDARSAHIADSRHAISERAAQATSEVLFCRPAPPLVRMGEVPLALLEADILAERVVAKYRAAFVRSS
jgi:hypothetical protein